MKSKPYQNYNNVNKYPGMNNQNPPPPTPPLPYNSNQSPYMPYPPPPPPNGYPVQPGYGYPMYNDQVQSPYPNYWPSVQYPQYPYPPMPAVPVPMNKSQNKPPKKVSLNYNPPKKAQKP